MKLIEVVQEQHQDDNIYLFYASKSCETNLELPYLRNDFSPKVTDKQAVESHSIEHLLRPTDSFVVIMQVQAQSIRRLVAL
jgi:hypothetical protein